MMSSFGEKREKVPKAVWVEQGVCFEKENRNLFDIVRLGRSSVDDKQERDAG